MQWTEHSWIHRKSGQEVVKEGGFTQTPIGSLSGTNLWDIFQHPFRMEDPAGSHLPSPTFFVRSLSNIPDLGRFWIWEFHLFKIGRSSFWGSYSALIQTTNKQRTLAKCHLPNVPPAQMNYTHTGLSQTDEIHRFTSWSSGIKYLLLWNEYECIQKKDRQSTVTRTSTYRPIRYSDVRAWFQVTFLLARLSLIVAIYMRNIILLNQNYMERTKEPDPSKERIHHYLTSKIGPQ